MSKTFIVLLLWLCFTAPPSHAFKSTSIQSFVSRSSSGGRSSASYIRQDNRQSSNSNNARSRSLIHIYQETPRTVRLAAAAGDNDATTTNTPPSTISDSTERRFSTPSTDRAEILVASEADSVEEIVYDNRAATSTVNERLLSEIQASVDKEKYGPAKKREYFKEFQSQRTDEERERSIEEAKDLNGVNPLVCIGGAGFAWACAGALWVLTTYLGVLFTSHPLETDLYIAQRVTQVFRNVVMGLSSLASGFFGVIGLGIFLLGIRVAYGVMTGELDPTPIKMSKSEEVVLPDVWGLMMGKKPNRRGKRGGLGSRGGEDKFGL